MNDEHTRYLEGLKARHAAYLARVQGRRGLLKKRVLEALRRRYAAQERETEAILTEIEAREAGSPS